MSDAVTRGLALAPPPRLARHRLRRTSADRLRDALLALGGHRGSVLAQAERAWASITFAGARHTVTLAFSGDEAVAAGERFVAELPEHEFAIPGQLVADATVTQVDHCLLPAPRLVIACEVLMLEES